MTLFRPPASWVMRQNQWNCIPAQHRFGKSVSVASSWTGWFELAVLVENWKILREYRSCDGHSRKEFAKSNETWEVRSAGLRLRVLCGPQASGDKESEWEVLPNDGQAGEAPCKGKFPQK